mgnify:CR=1 FL=1
MINLRTSLVFCIFVATFSLNDGDNLLDRIVYEASFLYNAGGRVWGLHDAFGPQPASHVRRMVLGLTANLPAEFPLNLGIDRDVFGGFMVSTLLVPMISRRLD